MSDVCQLHQDDVLVATTYQVLMRYCDFYSVGVDTIKLDICFIDVNKDFIQ